VPALVGCALLACERAGAGRRWLPQVPLQRPLQQRQQCRPHARLASQSLPNALRRRRPPRHLLPCALLRLSMGDFSQHGMRWTT